MAQFGEELRMYADNGLRSAQAWLEMGRRVAIAAAPRANVTCRGEPVQLFTRDQTRRCQEAQAQQ